jgi:hypothetical protein
MSEIMDDETPLRVANARNVSPSFSRRSRMAWATRAAILSSIAFNFSSIMDSVGRS